MTSADMDGGGEPLAGDGVTPGIVRIGDTVRRPVRPFTRTVQAYLAHPVAEVVNSWSVTANCAERGSKLCTGSDGVPRRGRGGAALMILMTGSRSGA